MINLTLPSLFSALRASLTLRWADLRVEPKTQNPGGIGHVSLVGAGPGSADLITLRGLQRLQRADVVYYDRLADPALLHHVRVGAAKVYVGKAPRCHAVPQNKINQLIV